MQKLIIYRIFIQNRNIAKTFLLYMFVILVTMCLSLIPAVIYTNYTDPYKDASFDYTLTDFDDNTIEELAAKDEVKTMYPLRIISAEFKKDEEVVPADLNCVDGWDEVSISYFGSNSIIKGEFDTKRADGIVLDRTLAKKLGADIDDTVNISIGKENVSFVVTAIIKPYIETGISQSVCLYNKYFKDIWNANFKEEPGFSYMFVDATSEDVLDDYMFEELNLPCFGKCSEEEKQIYARNCIFKKEWLYHDVSRMTRYTPPVTVCISILGALILLFFVVRENAEVYVRLEKCMAVLISIGERTKRIVYSTLIGQLIVLMPAAIVGAFLTKVVYDILLDNLYLTKEVIIGELIYVLIVSVLVSLISGIVAKRKCEKRLITELLK